MKINRIESLTFLRFVAALIVVIYHFGGDTFIAQLGKPAITAGPQMVSFFFVLSGFILMVVYYPKRMSLKEFYLARIGRILPVYLVALGITCYYVYVIVGNSNTIAPFLHLFFLQAWFPRYPMTLNFPGWTLSVEAFFYLTFPFLLMLIRAKRVRFQILLLISIAIWFFTQFFLTYLAGSEFAHSTPSTAPNLDFAHNFINCFPIFHYASFLLGVAGGYAFMQTQEYHQKLEKYSTLFLILSFALVYFALQYTTLFLARLNFLAFDTIVLYAPIFLPLIFCASYAQNRITKFLSLPVLVFLGEISYAIYIFQVPIHLLYKKYIQVYLELGANNYFYEYLLLLLLVASLSFYLIEKPGKRLILKWAALVENWYKEKLLYKSKESSSEL